MRSSTRRRLDAAETRQRLHELSQLGYSMEALGRRIGYSGRTLRDIHNGTARLVRCDIAEAVEQLDSRQLSLVAQDAYLIPAHGARHRLQALAAAGWSLTALARLPELPSNPHLSIIRSGEQIWITRDLDRRIRDAYEYAWNRQAPGQSAATRRDALRRGWRPPMDWDDALLDQPDIGTI